MEAVEGVAYGIKQLEMGLLVVQELQLLDGDIRRGILASPFSFLNLFSAIYYKLE